MDIVKKEIFQSRSVGVEAGAGAGGIDFDESLLATRLVQSVKGIIHSVPLPKTETIMTSFKIVVGETICSYAYIYSLATTRDTFEHVYYVCCPTYSSQDGEYRHRVAIYDTLEKMEKKYVGIISLTEKLIIEKINKGDIEFEAMFCFPFNLDVNPVRYKEEINTKRFAIRFFVLAWLADMDSYKNKFLENHVNPAYEHMLSTFDKKTHDKILSGLNEKEYHEFISDLSSPIFGVSVKTKNKFEYGQKFFPLTYKEIMSSGDILFPTWHELVVADKCADLMLNFISPSFPGVGSWALIQNVGSDVYDNAAMREKYRHSIKVGEIIRKLHDVNKMNYLDNKRMRGFINTQFAELSDNINKSIEFAEANIRLTDVMLCGFGEYTGRTFRDIPLLAQNMKHQDRTIYENVLCNYEHFRRHIFEFIYSLLCMNMKLKVMHGDLHVNNITLMILKVLTTSEDTIKNKGKEDKVVYILDGKKYFFEHDHSYSCIIDFSRAIYADSASLTDSFGVNYTRRYLKTQTYKTLNIISKYMPRFFNNFKTDIMDHAFFERFPLFFKVTTIMDVYCLATNMMSLLLTYKEMKVDPRIPELLTDIVTTAETLFVSRMKKIFTGELKTPEELDYPILTLIKINFASDIRDKLPGDNIIDVFNGDNDIIHHMRDKSMLGLLVTNADEGGSQKQNPETEKIIKLAKQYNTTNDAGDDEFASYSDDEWAY